MKYKICKRWPGFDIEASHIWLTSLIAMYVNMKLFQIFLAFVPMSKREVITIWPLLYPFTVLDNYLKMWPRRWCWPRPPRTSSPRPLRRPTYRLRRTKTSSSSSACKPGSQHQPYWFWKPYWCTKNYQMLQKVPKSIKRDNKFQTYLKVFQKVVQYNTL